MTLDDLIAIGARAAIVAVIVGLAACVCFCRAVDPKDCVTLTPHCLDEPDAGTP